MMDKTISLLKNGVICFPRLLLFHYKDLGLTDMELVFLLYLIGEDSVLNPKKISTDLKLDLKIVLEMIASLSDKDILKIDVINQHGICEEHINLDDLYSKLAFFVIEDKVEVSEKSNLFDIFEKEFGRTLSPMEFEIIKGWLSNHFSDELIISALKEAVYNGVFRLNYIDKILFEWRKKGIQTQEDVEKNNKVFASKKREVTEEVFEYDWLNEE